MVRRWRGHTIVHRAVIGIAADHLEPGGIRILTVLRDPRAAALVEAEMRALGNVRLGEQQIDLQIVRGFEFGVRLVRREPRTRDEFPRAAEDATRAAEDGKCRARWLRRERAARSVALADVNLPVALHQAFDVVRHDRWCFAEETAGTGTVVDADRDFVPLILF